MARKSNYFLFVVHFAFLLCLLPVAIYSFRHPSHNWDMLPYMALVLKMDNNDLNEVHKMTYSTTEANIPAEDYSRLITGNSRKEKAENPAAFNRLLPMYAVKPVYIWLSYFFYKTGFTLARSTVLPSILAYLCIGLLFFHWLSRHHSLIFSFVIGLIIMFSSIMVGAARLSTPDFLSALFLFIAFYLIIEKHSAFFAFLFLALSVLTRLDNIILSVLLIGFVFLNRKRVRIISTLQFIIMLFTLAGIYLLISSGVKQFNWDMFYYSDFIKYYDSADAAQPSFSVPAYLKLFSQRTIMALLYSHFLIFLFLVLLMYSVHFTRKLQTLPFELSFCGLLILTIALRFILFPDLEDRFYIAYYLVIIILFIQQFKNMIPERKPTPQTGEISA